MALRFSAERLRAECEAQGVTAQALAERAGRSVTAVHRWRCGRATPGADQLAALAEALGIPLEQLYVRVPAGPVEPAAVA